MNTSVLSFLSEAQRNSRSETEIEREIDRFLAGESNGQAVLLALYGSVADEPVPARLLAPLREPALPDEAAPAAADDPAIPAAGTAPGRSAARR